MIERTLRTATNLFPLWTVVFSGAALVWPAAFTWSFLVLLTGTVLFIVVSHFPEDR